MIVQQVSLIKNKTTTKKTIIFRRLFCLLLLRLSAVNGFYIGLNKPQSTSIMALSKPICWASILLSDLAFHMICGLLPQRWAAPVRRIIQQLIYSQFNTRQKKAAPLRILRSQFFFRLSPDNFFQLGKDLLEKCWKMFTVLSGPTYYLLLSYMVICPGGFIVVTKARFCFRVALQCFSRIHEKQQSYTTTASCKWALKYYKYDTSPQNCLVPWLLNGSLRLRLRRKQYARCLL